MLSPINAFKAFHRKMSSKLVPVLKLPKNRLDLCWDHFSLLAGSSGVLSQTVYSYSHEYMYTGELTPGEGLLMITCSKLTGVTPSGCLTVGGQDPPTSRGVGVWSRRKQSVSSTDSHPIVNDDGRSSLLSWRSSLLSCSPWRSGERTLSISSAGLKAGLATDRSSAMDSSWRTTVSLECFTEACAARGDKAIL